MKERRSKRVLVGQARVTINLPDELAAFVEAQCRQSAKTVSAFFRELANAERQRLQKAA